MISLKNPVRCLAAACLLASATWAAAQTYDPMAAARAPSATEGEEPVKLNPEFGDLPDGEGVEETYYQCSACHSTAIIKQQHLSDARWDYLWGWMVEDQGMVEPDEADKKLILSYLKQHFSSER